MAEKRSLLGVVLFILFVQFVTYQEWFGDLDGYLFTLQVSKIFRIFDMHGCPIVVTPRANWRRRETKEIFEGSIGRPIHPLLGYGT
jgi:hypothetical protein